MATAGCRAVFITSHAFFNTALEVQSHDCARVVAHYSVHVHTHWHWHYSAEACVRACVALTECNLLQMLKGSVSLIIDILGKISI